MDVDLDITLNFSRPALCRLVVGRGAMAEGGRILSEAVGGGRAVWIADPMVQAAVGETVERSLAKGFDRVDRLSLGVGESAKTVEGFAELIGALHSIGADRRTTLIAVGGGSATDVVGFVAASYLRGVPYAAIPTTLTAQVDAAIGGKVAVNTAAAKNLIGSFYHPRAILVDPTLLDLSHQVQWQAGMAEILKVAVIADKSLFFMVECTLEHILDRPHLLDQIVRRAVSAKLALLTPDPFESDLNRLLNFGHETAHALETATRHRLGHGEAVSIGVATATRIAGDRKLLASDCRDRIVTALERYELPTRWTPTDGEMGRFASALSLVTLVRGGNLRTVLPTGLGSGQVVHDIDVDDISAAVAAQMAAGS